MNISVLGSKFAKNHPSTGNKIEALLDSACTLGATKGAQRLAFICDQYDQLTPNSAYLWIDPNTFLLEIEEHQTHRKLAQVIHFFRIFFSLAPLIATWVALGRAVDEYQHNWRLHPEDNTVPFLQQWQEGFHSTTPFTFTMAANITISLLFLYLLSIFANQWFERYIHNIAEKFVRELQCILDELIQCIANDSIAYITQGSDINRVIDSVRKVIDGATDALKKVVDSATAEVKETASRTVEINKVAMANAQQCTQQIAEHCQQSIEKVIITSEQSITQSHAASQQAIVNVNTRVNELFDQQVKPLIQTFKQDMAALQKELGSYQGRLNDLTNASQKVAQASQGLVAVSRTLTDNADRYMTIGESIGIQIATLNNTQQGVLVQISAIAGNISTAAGNMSTATTNMVAATTAVEDLTSHLGNEMRSTIAIMTQNVDKASQQVDIETKQIGAMSNILNQMITYVSNITQALGQTSTSLQSTAHKLDRVSVDLSLLERKNLFGFLRKKQPKGRGLAI